MLHWKSVFHIGPFEHPIETLEPNLARAFVDFKRNMSGSHPWRAIFLGVERRATKNRYEKFGGLFLGLLPVGRGQRGEVGLLLFFLKNPPHSEEICLSPCPLKLAVLRWGL